MSTPRSAEPHRTPAARHGGGADLAAQLGASRDALARQAQRQAALAEITAALTGLREPSAVLQRTVDEAVHLLDAFGAALGLIDPAGRLIRWAFDAGMDEPTSRGLRDLDIPVGSGLVGAAFATQQQIVTGDYLADARFPHLPGPDRWIVETEVRSMVAGPLPGVDGPLGILAIFSRRPAAFSDDDLATVETLAHQAAIALANARLIEELDRSRTELERRATAERSLREIAARITAVRDPDAVLQTIVDEARRLLRSDGAHLTLLSDDGQHLIPGVVAGGLDAETTAWLKEQRFPVGGGMNGIAAQLGKAVSTADYLEDPRIPHGPEDHLSANRLELRGMAVAPLRAPGGEIAGTLAISYREPRPIDEDALALLQSLADQAAISVVNSRLDEALSLSEQRYRFLLENSPDIVFSCDADGRFSFLSDTVERLTSWRAAELIGQHFSALVQPASLPEAEQRWAAVAADPSLIQIFRLQLRTRDGSTIPTELNSVGITVDGRFAGVHGSARDLSEREQLERDLRHQAAELAASDERAHLARELHDSVTQALFSMTLQTRAAELLLTKDPPAAAEKLVTLRDLQRDALAEMRSLIFELRPGGIAEHGLVHALRTHATAIQGRVGLPVIFESSLEEDERLPLEIEESLYRIAQEALHNVVKHAAATHVRLALGRDRGAARLTVADDGVGFDPSAVPKGHLGLEGMRARAERVGGHLEISSQPGRGTVLAAIMPADGEA